MEGPVLSGGVIVLVAVLLWVLYFLPSWRGRHQFEAAERNAVRLNRALRVLAETSETPDEVRLELTARTALAQQRLAKRVQSEKEAAELARLRAELAATRADPAVRQARARRRVRLSASALAMGGLVAGGVGIWQMIATGASLALWVGGIAVISGSLVLRRMATVAARAARPVATAAQATPRVSAPLHDQGPAVPTPWTPRSLPEPLVQVAGSRAHAAQEAIDAQRRMREAARAAELQAKAEQLAPPAPPVITPPVVAEAPAPASVDSAPAESAESPYARMGYVDDAEIEAHVRALLARRAAG